MKQIPAIFVIDIDHAKDVTHVDVRYLVDMDNPSDKDLVKIIKSEHKITTTSSRPHPKFAELRDRLEDEGYIEVERRWHNGDRVLKPFILNELIFEKGDKFPSAAYMSTLFAMGDKISSYKRITGD